MRWDPKADKTRGLSVRLPYRLGRGCGGLLTQAEWRGFAAELGEKPAPMRMQGLGENLFSNSFI